MKRIERAIERENKKLKDRIIIGSCPCYIDNELPDLDDEIKMFNSDGNIIGCRGITCEECWNQEIEKEK